MSKPTFSILQLSAAVEFCAMECEKQRSGERSVSCMFHGWRLAWEHRGNAPDDQFIQILGWIVEPRVNRPGVYRNTRVGVMDNGEFHPKAEPDQVPRLMRLLIGSWHDLSAEEWYREYEEIHPFGDGNGRTGSLLYNLHKGTLEPSRLLFPPNFWGPHPHAEEMENWNRDAQGDWDGEEE